MNSLYQQGVFGQKLMEDLELKNCFKTSSSDYEFVFKNDSIFDIESANQTLFDINGVSMTQDQIDLMT